MGYENYTARQKSGSEFGGVGLTKATIQPKPSEAITPAEQLRLGYVAGVESETESLEDRRQMLGLLPADQKRPSWLSNTGQNSQAKVEGLGEL